MLRFPHFRGQVVKQPAPVVVDNVVARIPPGLHIPKKSDDASDCTRPQSIGRSIGGRAHGSHNTDDRPVPASRC